MTNQHPLTNEICRQIAPCGDLWSPTAECHDMRAAADWQLECDAEWWRIILTKSERFPPETVEYIIEEFKRVMRPQENG